MGPMQSQAYADMLLEGADGDEWVEPLEIYPTGKVVGNCVCGSWPGGECLRCPVIPDTTQQEK